MPPYNKIIARANDKVMKPQDCNRLCNAKNILTIAKDYNTNKSSLRYAAK